MHRSTTRILTTHCGSLPRPTDLLDLMKAKIHGDAYDPEVYAARVRSAVSDIVRQQMECGIDIPTDGEQGKQGFFAYVNERLTGFEPSLVLARPCSPPKWRPSRSTTNNISARRCWASPSRPWFRLSARARSHYRGQEAVRRDIENLKAALQRIRALGRVHAGGCAERSGKERVLPHLRRIHARARRGPEHEYRAIVDAGFLLQIDDPFLTELYSYSSLSAAERRKTAETYVEALNHGLRGIPPEKVRFHTCYGINEGPRVHDAPLKDMLEVILKVNAGAYSFEAANPRHEHEYHVFENVKLPDGKLIIPGVITHASNIVEHPELIAERIVRFARLVGRENVIAGTDCGFSSQATYQPEIHPSVMWAKFRAMAEGARLASEQLW